MVEIEQGQSLEDLRRKYANNAKHDNGGRIPPPIDITDHLFAQGTINQLRPHLQEKFTAFCRTVGVTGRITVIGSLVYLGPFVPIDGERYPGWYLDWRVCCSNQLFLGRKLELSMVLPYQPSENNRWYWLQIVASNKTIESFGGLSSQRYAEFRQQCLSLRQQLQNLPDCDRLTKLLIIKENLFVDEC